MCQLKGTISVRYYKWFDASHGVDKLDFLCTSEKIWIHYCLWLIHKLFINRPQTVFFTRPGQGCVLRRSSYVFFKRTLTTAIPATDTENRQQGPARVQWRYPHWHPFSYCTLGCRHAPWDASLCILTISPPLHAGTDSVIHSKASGIRINMQLNPANPQADGSKLPTVWLIKICRL